MATVYVATDLRLERRVALKVMHSHLSDDTVFQGRFIQEARAAARLADPHVVNVFDQGQDGDMAYLVMEYLPGIARRLHRARELGEPFDFLTWFEYAPEQSDAFEEMVARLRSSEEWRYVEREVDVRLTKIQG